MPTILSPLITDAGLAAAIAQNGAGLQLAITHVALGTGQYTPAAGQTALTNRKEKVTIGAGIVTTTGGFSISVLFPAWAGVPNPYNATEIGFYAGDPDAGGVLFAVFSHPSSVIVQRNALDYVASFGLQLSRVPANSVTVTVDPAGPQSLSLLNSHVNAADPHPVYAQKTGIQAQTYEAFTSAGAAPTFTLTPTPAPAALVAGLRYRVKFNVDGNGSDTLNIATLGAKSLKQYNSVGAKVAASFKANQLADVEYDGVDLVILDPLPVNGLLHGKASHNATATLSVADLGKLLTFTGSTAAQTLTLPAIAGVESGKPYWFVNQASVPVTLKGNAAELINANNISASASSGNTLLVNSGDSVMITSNGASWDTFGSVASKQFPNSLGANQGYAKFPNGTIMQFGLLDGASVAGGFLTYPIAFPNAAYYPVVGSGTAGGQLYTWSNNALNGFNYDRGGASSSVSSYIVIGR